MKISTLFYDNKLISETQKLKLSERLFIVFSKMWTGYDFAQFKQYFFSTPCEQDKTYEYYHDGKLIGYVILRLVSVDVQGHSAYVMRISANVLPSYIGLNLTTNAIFKQGFRFFLSSLLKRKKFYIFVTANSPASYCALINRTLIAYPSPYTRTPPHIAKISYSLAEMFKFGPDPKNPFKCQFKGVFMNDAIQKKLSLRSSRVSRYYTSHCPNFARGEALIVILPLTLFLGIAEIGNQIFHMVMRSITRRYRLRVHKFRRSVTYRLMGP